MTEQSQGFTLGRLLILGLWMLAAFVVLIILGVLIVSLEMPPLITTAMFSGAMLAAALFLVFADGGRFRGMGLETSWQRTDVWLVLGMLVVYISGALTVSVMETAVIPALTGSSPPPEVPVVALFSLFGELSPLPFFGLALLMAVFAGVGEELFFRGYLITRLERLGMPGWAVVSVTALLFGLAHVDGYGLVSSIAKGVLLGMPTALYFWYRRRLLPLIVLHILIDFSVFTATYAALRLGGGIA